MGSNLASKAQFERAKWRMAILGPLWVLQTGLALGVAGTSSWQLARTLYNHYVSDGGSSSDFPTLDVA